MTDWSELDRLPADVLRVRTPRAVFAVQAALAEALARAGYTAEADGAVAPSDLAGRSLLGEIVLGAERLVVRRFTHGGLLRWLTGRRYLDPLRPFRELALSRRLAACGVPVPEVVAARARRLPAGAWELELVSRRIEGAVDLGTLARRAVSGALEPGLESRAARAFGALVRRLHDLGFLHADLTPRNFLVDPASLRGERARLWVLDLDGSRFLPALGEAQRVANLARLLRHVERMVREGDLARRGRVMSAFLRAYEPRRAERRRLGRAVRERVSSRRAWHAFGSALESRAGAKRSRPRE
ncbi:MAG: hypothetical protein IPK67_17965 [Planctomycetes bacterium]|nr:hypothetical protein [Planctomycetota bacterium]